MKRNTWLPIVGVLAAMLMTWAGGCQENVDPNSRQARLAVAKSEQLEGELARCQARIESLRDEYERLLEDKDAQLAAARKLSAELEQDIRGGIDARIEAVTEKVMNDNARLRRENEALRAELAKLRMQQ